MAIADYMAITVLIISVLVVWFFPGVIMEWQRIVTAPFDRDPELAVIDYDGVHALAFPCRRILGSWINAETKKKIEVYPTHWRAWQDPR
jgi:hypothetical protein